MKNVAISRFRRLTSPKDDAQRLALGHEIAVIDATIERRKAVGAITEDELAKLCDAKQRAVDSLNALNAIQYDAAGHPVTWGFGDDGDVIVE